MSKKLSIIFIVSMLLASCATTSKIDIAKIDYDEMLAKAELSLEMAKQIYVLWGLTHELLGTDSEELIERRELFLVSITNAEVYLDYVQNLVE